jgi:signal transduction histidine kinase
VYMESMLLNLVTNAVKYAKPGQAPVIYISTKIKDGRKQMIFADEGLGFDMDKVKDRIFGINQKFHDHADSKGIGLYLVHSHVVRMGGQIEVASKVNNGTTFTITFAD